MPRPTSTLLIGLWLLPTAAIAQVAPSAMAATVNVFASNTQAQPMPAGSQVWPGFARTANGANGGASLVVTHELTSNCITMRWDLACQASSTGQSAAAGGIRYELQSAVPQVGNLIVVWHTATNGSAQAGLAVDLFDDGVIDAPSSSVLPVTFGPQSLPIRVTAGCDAQAGTLQGPWGSSWSWAGSAAATLELRFEPAHANVQTVAVSPCASAPQLSAVANLFEGVDVDGAFSPGDDAAIVVLGFTGVNVPLPWSSGCLLLVDPLVTAWQPLVGSPSATFAVPVPRSVRPIAFQVQLLGFDVGGGAFSGTDALLVNAL